MEVARGGERLALPASKKTRALLAYLAVTAKPHRRERLCELLWDVPDDPRGALRWSLSKLRGLVDEPGLPRIVATRETAAFEPRDVRVDVADMRSRIVDGIDAAGETELRAAAELFRGDFLEGLDLDNCPGFQSWCVAERELARRQHRQILEALVERLQERPTDAVIYARRLVETGPYDESARAKLIKLLAAIGHREEAESVFAEGERLRREDGKEVGAALRSAMQALRGRPIARSAAAPSPATDRADGARDTAKEAKDPSSDVATLDRPASAPVAEPPPHAEPERKHVTVVAARLREQEGAAGDADPELALRFDPARAALRQAMLRHGGTITVEHPDGLIAVFGAPLSYEDHAVRACRAALAAVAATRDASQGRLGIAAAIHSGEVIVRPAGDGASGRFEAIGPVVNRARQVEMKLDRPQVVVTAETRRRAEGFVRVGDLPADGTPRGEGADLALLVGLSPARSRWQARAAQGLSRFVGRDAELAVLRRALERAGERRGQVVAVVGEPGMGKSRLTHEFVHSLVPHGWTVLEASADTPDSQAAYLPFSNLLRRWFEVEDRDAQPEIARKVQLCIGERYPELMFALPAFSALLDLHVEDAAWAAFTPGQRRRRTLDAIKALIARECRERPVVLLFEDLHWIDEESRAAIDALVDSLGAMPLLLLVTFRPEYLHAWSGRSNFAQIRLASLDQTQGAALLEALLGTDRSVAALKEQLLERGEGTPLFLEETVRSLADSGALSGAPGQYRLPRPIGALQIPATVQSVLAARIDRLPSEAKNLLQIAAVIGKDLPLALVQQVAGLSEERLHEHLATLRASELLYETSVLPDVVYSFKHALTQEVAYGSMLRERRRALHVELFRTIRSHYRDRLEEQVERLAYHARAGELWDDAVENLYLAAEKAIRRSAHRQAAELLAEGLELIAKLPEGSERLRRELNFHKAMGVTMMAAKGWAAPEVANAYAQARAISERLGDQHELFVALRGQGQFHMIRGELVIARDLGDRCMALVKDEWDVGAHIESHHLFWSTGFFMGDYANAEHHAGRGMALYERERDHRLTYMYSGHDPGVCCRCFSALLLWQQGYAEKALRRGREALDLALSVSHPLTIALTYWAMSYLHLLRREPEQSRHWAEHEIAVCDEYMLPLLHSQGTFQVGWALAAEGIVEQGLERMRAGLDAIRATSAEMGLPYFVALYGEALAAAGRSEDGLAQVEQAIAMAERNRTNFQLPEMLRLRGELLLRLDPADRGAAAAEFESAIAAAKAQGSRLLGLRAATSLARLLEGQGESPKARALLTPLLAAFDEGLDGADFAEARAIVGR